MTATVVSMRLGLALLFAAAAPAEAPRVTIRGNGTDLGPAPVVVALDVRVAPGGYLLKPDGDGPSLRADVVEFGGRRHLAVMLDRLGANEVRTFRLQPSDARLRRDLAIAVEPEDEEVRVLVGDKPFTTLRQGEFKPYFWPVNGPTGDSYTRAYPMEEVEGEDHDHPHQRSFWFTHGDVNGFDFWSSDPKNGKNPRFGTIKQTSLKAEGGLAVGLIRTTDDWIGGDGKKLCEDERTFTFSAAEGRRFIDADATVKATEGPVTFGETKEGSFGFRLASSMDVNRRQGGHIVNAEGITDTEAWGKPSPWVDYTGPVDGQTVGVAIFDHPQSFRHPTTWHVRDYGLFAANPFGYKDFGIKDREGAYTIPAGGSIRFRYRVVLHDGDTDSANIPAAYRGFAEPPTVEVSTD